MAGGDSTTFGFVRRVTKLKERLPVPNTTKQDLILATAKMYDATQAEVAAVVEQFLSVVTGRLAMGHSVEIRGFGTFSTRNHGPRTGRNVRTGEIVPIPAHKIVRVKFPKGYLNA